MLKQTIDFITAHLGGDGGFFLNVHGVVTLALFICCGVLTHMFLRQQFLIDKEWEPNPIRTKVRTITKGFIGLILAFYSLYLLVAWSSWTIATLMLVGVISIVGSILTTCLLWLGVIFIRSLIVGIPFLLLVPVVYVCLAIYNWIKDLMLLLKENVSIINPKNQELC